MPGRHAAPAGPRSLPLSLADSSSLTRAGIAAALVTASAAAVAGSTGMFASAGSDVAPAAATATLTTDSLAAYSPAAAAIPAPRAPEVMPVAAAAPATKAAPVKKEPVKKAATPTKAKAKAVPTKAAAPAAAAGLGSLGTRIVAKAASFEGTPYAYGATGPSSFDCSGLTKHVFGKMGISIPRTAQQQYDAAQHLSRSQAQPGDLIFMGSPSNIYHVAIYAGNGKIWTAPKPGDSVELGNLWGNWHVGRIR